MSYLVLARKWRPRTFSEVVGQDHVTLTLMKAVDKGRLAHAYLFAGPRGCGKTTVARLLAKVINCGNRSGSEPCNSCPSCSAVNDGRHLDVIEIDGASNRGIDEIRDLREKIGYAPSLGDSKIYIIDEVHMLTPQAFNALLKTLEEPPPHVYLVFATTEPHKVPPTILSRCQRFNFKRLELPEIKGQLEKICTIEKVKFDPDAVVLLSRRAEGSMRDAESLLDQCISASDGKIGMELVRRVLGLVDSQLIIELLGAISRKDRPGSLAVADSVVSSGLDLEEFFLAYLEGLRNMLVISVVGKDSPDMLDLTAGELEELRRISECFRTEDLIYLFRSAARAFREFKLSNQPRYHLEASLAEAASWESAEDLSNLLKRLDRITGRDGGSRGGEGADAGVEVPGSKEGREGGTGLEGCSHEDNRLTGEMPGAGTGPAAIPGKSVEADGGDSVTGAAHASDEGFARLDQAPGAAVGVGDMPSLEGAVETPGKEAWERFLSKVRESKLTLGIWLMSAELERIGGDRVVLAFGPQNRFAREMIFEEKNRRYIESQLARFFGRRLMIETLEAEPAGPVKNLPCGEENRSPGKREIPIPEGAPMIKRLIEEFDGELCGGDK